MPKVPTVIMYGVELSELEAKVIELVYQGLSTKAIADRLQINFTCVKSARARACEKFGLDEKGSRKTKLLQWLIKNKNKLPDDLPKFVIGEYVVATITANSELRVLPKIMSKEDALKMAAWIYNNFGLGAK